MIVELFEHRNRVLGDLPRVFTLVHRVGVDFQHGELDCRVRDDASVPARCGLRECRFGCGEVTRLAQRCAELRQQCDATRIVVRVKRHGALVEESSGRHVAAPERRDCGARIEAGGALAERASVLVERAELRQIAMRLFEVVCDDLVVLRHALADHRLEPHGEALVQLRARLLRHCLVRRVAYDQIAEAECVVAAEERLVRSDQLLADEREQVRRNARTRRLGRQVLDGAAVEHLSLDRAALDRRALVGL